jgi:PBP1b-binding outer membrane lipoprotein LpoB
MNFKAYSLIILSALFIISCKSNKEEKTDDNIGSIENVDELVEDTAKENN